MKRSIRILKQELSDSSDNSFQACKCNEISRLYMYRDVDQVQHYGHLALEHAKKANNTREIARAYFNIGAGYFLCQNLKEGVAYYSLAAKLIKEEDPQTLVRIYMGIGVNFTQINCHQESVYYQEKALQIAVKENLIPEKAGIYNNIGRVYSDLGDHQLAMNYYQRGLQIAYDEGLQTIKGYLLVGAIQNDLKHNALDDVESNLLRLEKLIDKHNEMWYLGISQCLWGCYYAASDSLGCAKEYFTTGIEILEAEGQNYYLALAYAFYTDTLTRQGELFEAKLAYDLYKAMIDKYSLDLALPMYYGSLSDFYAKQSDVRYYNKYNQLYTESKDALEIILREHF